jgi:hypothetical protein
MRLRFWKWLVSFAQARMERALVASQRMTAREWQAHYAFQERWIAQHLPQMRDGDTLVVTRKTTVAE